MGRYNTERGTDLIFCSVYLAQNRSCILIRLTPICRTAACPVFDIIPLKREESYCSFKAVHPIFRSFFNRILLDSFHLKKIASDCFLDKLRHDLRVAPGDVPDTAVPAVFPFAGIIDDISMNFE